jgi:hypothetical protein
MQDIKVLGIDLAKAVFQLHGVDAVGKQLLKKRIARNKLHEYIFQLYSSLSISRWSNFHTKSTMIDQIKACLCSVACFLAKRSNNFIFVVASS